MRQIYSVANKSYVSICQLLVVGLVLACLPCYPQILHADEPGKATLQVKAKKRSGLGTLEYYVGGALVLSVKSGQDKEIQFTPIVNGKTKFKRILWSAFGTKTSEYEYKWQVGPSGVVEFNENPNEGSWGVLKAGWDVSKLKVVLDDKSYEREIASEIVNTLPGAKRTIKRSRMIERSVSVTDTDSVEKSIAATIGIFSGHIRAKIEKSRSTTYKESETIEQAVEIDGKELPKVKVVWVERTLRGKATILIDGKETVVPFAFRENLEMRLEAVK